MISCLLFGCAERIEQQSLSAHMDASRLPKKREEAAVSGEEIGVDAKSDSPSDQGQDVAAEVEVVIEACRTSAES